MTAATGKPRGRRPVGGTGRAGTSPRVALAAVHVEALAVLCARWQCSESEAIRRAIVAEASR